MTFFKSWPPNHIFGTSEAIQSSDFISTCRPSLWFLAQRQWIQVLRMVSVTLLGPDSNWLKSLWVSDQ